MKTCKDCIHAKWERTPTGRIKRNESGRCEVSLQWIENQIRFNLPICASITVHNKSGIWPDTEHNCPVHQKEET